MPRKSDSDTAPAHEVKPVVAEDTSALMTFFFPTVGNGVAIQAVSQEEANEKIKKHPFYKA